jgi:hypothetical protein
MDLLGWIVRTLRHLGERPVRCDRLDPNGVLMRHLRLEMDKDPFDTTSYGRRGWSAGGAGRSSSVGKRGYTSTL